MITIGIDSGSLTTKGVVLKENKIQGFLVIKTGGDNQKSALNLYKQLLKKTQIQEKDISLILATGYGRENIPFSNSSITEITCHAMGMRFTLPEVKTILDIGGQDSKTIHVDEFGRSSDFIMNDKCAAGTGRFLEVLANALGVKLEQLGKLSEQSLSEIKISNMCTVFAESEVISLVAKGTPIQDIINGVHNAIAERSMTLLNRLGVSQPVAMSGGVAFNTGVVKSLEKMLQQKIFIPENPQIIGALGAAVIAQKKAN